MEIEVRVRPWHHLICGVIMVLVISGLITMVSFSYLSDFTTLNEKVMNKGHANLSDFGNLLIIILKQGLVLLIELVLIFGLLIKINKKKRGKK